MLSSHLRAGLLPASPFGASLCLHCTRPLTGAESCRCGFERDDRRPRHDLAEIVLNGHGARCAS